MMSDDWRRGVSPMGRSLSSPHIHAHECAHHTLNQSAMDKKIMPLSFLECSPLYTHSPSTHPSPHTKHRLSVGSFLLQAVARTQIWMIFHNLYKSASWCYRRFLPNI